ncbi:phytoene desaturase family protein [Nocardia bhagyanarayanae]|uniref:All-trans-retinol 13,14-reductase n=1 Tax=Nocardia bhagyanarayanae TaxID=1215925 RepID=A0A543FFG4_9NOCA|nr:NAD(P)/FAD-dependent oxidoreductase [Nocardia bhagyanarayanae]TQM32494.1 all-trans-retinol 13,14-reductase [Nocardia bhagyanarayanae]
MPEFDSIVIGSGLGGSSAAAHLAAAGQRVLLLERYSVLGGSSHVFRRQGKWEFDCGVHYVGDCGPGGQIPTLMRGLGLDDRITWLPLDAAGFDTVRGPDLEFRLPADWDGYEANLVAAFPQDATGLRRMVRILRAIGEPWDRDRTPATISAQWSWIRKTGPAAAFAALPVISLFTMCGLAPRTILALSVHCGLLGSTPTRATTALYAVLLHNYVGGGAYYPRGGGQALSAGFAEVTASHGGTIRRNAAVEKILIDNNRVRGVRLAGGETITASSVVSAADILRTFRDLVGHEHLPLPYRARISQLKMSLPFINAYFGIEMDLSTAPNCNFFAIPTWDDATSLLKLANMQRTLLGGAGFADGEQWARRVAARQPMFVQSSSRRDPAHAAAAPAGHATVEVQSIVPHRPRLWGVDGYDIDGHEYRNDRTYNNVKAILLEGMAQRMEQAFPGAGSAIRFCELATPATQERYVGNTCGAPFGLDVTPTQIGPLRPGTRTPVEGLYLAGTSTAWGPATEGAMLSGRQAASAILGRDLSAEVRDGAVLADPSKLTAWPSDFDALRSASSQLDKTA